MPSKTERLRQLINDPAILVLPGIYDGYSARMVTQAGFPAGFVTGAGISEASLGWSDLGVMGCEENLRVCRAIVGCCDLPLLADGDTGYGNAVNVHFTVRGFEQAGLAGLMIEDQVWPKRCGHMKGKEVISAPEAVEKIRAAAEARRDPSFVIMSRTDTLATHGIAEVIRRLNLYAEAGADLLFADAVLSVEDISAVVSGVSKPVCVNMGFGVRRRSTTPLLSARQLQDLGVAVVIYPRLLTASALQGMRNALAALDQSLTTGEVVDRPDLLLSFEDLNTVMGMAELQRLEQRYLTAEQFSAKYRTAAE
jgi:2-methylisocitrate lyase-like PEP mutase family enzyme